jgi:hypothetical protein
VNAIVDNDGTEITVLVQATLDLSTLGTYATGEDGRLISLSYHHEDFYPALSGIVLHYKLPTGRVVVTYPDPDGFTLLWRDDMTVAKDIDEGAEQVLHTMWDVVNSLFETTLRKQFGMNTAQAIVAALNAGAGR